MCRDAFWLRVYRKDLSLLGEDTEDHQRGAMRDVMFLLRTFPHTPPVLFLRPSPFLRIPVSVHVEIWKCFKN
jgi:hypothetical protein